jgi:hypothetical protein
MPIHPLTAARHARARLRPLPDMGHAARQNHAQLGLSEVRDALADYPIFLLKHADSGRFNLCALFALEGGASWFMIQGGWQATYLPRNLLRQPFHLAPGAGGVFDLAVEEETDRLHDRDGEPLFDAHGQPTARTEQLGRLLASLRDDLAAARGFVDRLAALDLICPVDMLLTFGDGRENQIEGLYSIGEGRLRDLPDADVLALHREGHLALAHAVMASATQVHRLQQLHNATAKVPLTRIAKAVREE